MNGYAPTYDDFLQYQRGRAAEVTAERFCALLPDSEARVDAFIFPNSVDENTPAAAVEAYKKAVCAVVCVAYDYPAGASTHYTSGKVSETFTAETIPTADKAAKYYLSGSGLLCRWL